MLKTLFFAVIFFFVVRWVSRLFLGHGKKKNSNFRVMYQAFQNIKEQKEQQQNQQRQQPTQNGTVQKNDLDNIEEAEYEDVTEDKNDQ